MIRRKISSGLLWFLTGLPFVLVCALLIWLPNRSMFNRPTPGVEGVRSDVPWSRSVVEFSKDVFSDAVSRSDWAELRGNVLRPKAGKEDLFRERVNVNQCASILSAEYPDRMKWDEGSPSLEMPSGRSRKYLQIPSWVLWAFQSELQGL